MSPVSQTISVTPHLFCFWFCTRVQCTCIVINHYLMADFKHSQIRQHKKRFLGPPTHTILQLRAIVSTNPLSFCLAYPDQLIFWSGQARQNAGGRSTLLLLALVWSISTIHKKVPCARQNDRGSVDTIAVSCSIVWFGDLVLWKNVRLDYRELWNS